jgi:hypothetical protein
VTGAAITVLAVVVDCRGMVRMFVTGEGGCAVECVVLLSWFRNCS